MGKLISRKTANRVLLGLAGAVLLGFLWQYTETGRTPALGSGSRPPAAANYFLRGTSASEYDAQGQLSAIITSPEIVHQPATDSARMRNPAFRFYEQGELTWTVDASWGELYGNGQRIELEQQVLIASADQRNQLKTPALTVFPKRQVAVTDRPVSLSAANGFTRATGMRANLKKERIELQQNVRGQYDILP